MGRGGLRIAGGSHAIGGARTLIFWKIEKHNSGCEKKEEKKRSWKKESRGETLLILCGGKDS